MRVRPGHAVRVQPDQPLLAFPLSLDGVREYQRVLVDTLYLPCPLLSHPGEVVGSEIRAPLIGALGRYVEGLAESVPHRIRSHGGPRALPRPIRIFYRLF